MSGVLQKLMPARSQAQQPRVVTDLDALIAEPVGFRFHGHVYTLKPVETRTFLKMADILGRINGMVAARAKDVDSYSDEDFHKANHEYIAQLCPEFTLARIKELTLPQLSGLLMLVIRHSTGQTDEPAATAEKKKMIREA